ncbi:hypothetical protein CGCA056_v013453 [Colletotrichum aenigma]|uniref:uncharacterized protein n=1 Tax=Colletotrichum aenigma TaxID=1215731 RepID=UPI001872FE33|nr:uncharacterized protein CGCA056_v013453 [Colletotrichum aenigma]KAF5507181.1 hypothetical protein CGCA056_v013453 [Colletotrichum aenigma]
MVNYQLFLLNHDEEYLAVAIKQFEERVDICRRLRASTDSQEDSRQKAAKAQTATAHEAIAFHCLSLCYTVQGHLDKAIGAAWDGQKLAVQSGDPKKALAQVNPSDGYTPVAALWEEPCEEYRGYDILIEALNRQLNHDEVQQHPSESALESAIRKGYRELLQEILRPVLLEADKRSSITRLRQVYAKALATDEEKALHFDAFKYVRFADFARHGKLPKSSENLTRRFGDDGDEELYVIFMSYTWSKQKGVGGFSPDDMGNTKYHQMMSALKNFLLEHPDVNPKTVCVWLDWACIDQDNRGIQTRGVAALPMCVAQCNAMISITEDNYYERA